MARYSLFVLKEPSKQTNKHLAGHIATKWLLTN